MDSIYTRIRSQALIIAAKYPPPDFYQAYEEQVEYSSRFFSEDAMIVDLRGFVAGKIENDFGHGLDHAKKVALDAGALMAIESRQCDYSSAQLKHLVRMAQCAGLFHDILRKEENHARRSADYAAQILKGYSFADGDVVDICVAIRNHEAFKETEETVTPEGALLSDCLYDSDKFRWGPENFTHTVWDMVKFGNIPVKQFVSYYPRGIAFLDKIKPTFRSRTGKAFGPQFIDLGLAIGRELYAYIQTEKAEYFV